MAVPGDINLIRTKTRLSPELLALADRLRVIGWVALVSVIVVGMLTGLVFLELQRERQMVSAEKERLLATIAKSARKESLFVSLKDRIPLVTRALNTQKPWGQILDMVSTIAVPPDVYSISVDDHQMVLVNLKTTSFAEVSRWISRVTDLVGAARIRSPQLVSFQLLKGETILLTVSFIPQ